MKYSISTIVFIFVLLAHSYGQYNFSLEITTPDNLNGQSMFFNTKDSRFDADIRLFINQDSVIINNNKAVFVGEIPGFSELATLSLKDSQGIKTVMRFVIDTGLNRVGVQNEGAFQKLNFSSENNSATLSTNVLSDLSSLYDHYVTLYGDTVVTYPDEQKIVVLNKLPRINEFNKEKLKIIESFPQLYFSLIELFDLSRRSLFRENPEEILAAVERLEDHIKQSDLGKMLIQDLNNRTSAFKRSRIGEPVPIFSVRSADKQEIINTDLLGQTYIIAFSATWCIPCQAHLPLLKELHDKYQDISVIYFNLDKDDVKWRRHIEKNDLQWINVSEGIDFHDSPIAKVFNVTAVPLYILVNKEGNIVYNDRELNDQEFDKLEEYILKAL